MFEIERHLLDYFCSIHLNKIYNKDILNYSGNYKCQYNDINSIVTLKKGFR